jgi:hypothetical protein
VNEFLDSRTVFSVLEMLSGDFCKQCCKKGVSIDCKVIVFLYIALKPFEMTCFFSYDVTMLCDVDLFQSGLERGRVILFVSKDVALNKVKPLHWSYRLSNINF